MTTWLTLKERTLRDLDDTNRSSPTWSDSDLLDYVNYALREFAVDHTALEKSTTLTLSVGLTVYEMPTDLIAIGPLVYINGAVQRALRRIKIEPGRVLAVPSTNTAFSEWYEWPDRTINIVGTPSTGSTIKVMYYAYYTELAADGDVLQIPRWSEMAVQWLIKSHAYAREAGKSSMLRQWNTKTDSGTPTDNALLDYARYCRRQYDELISNHPRQDRTYYSEAD